MVGGIQQVKTGDVQFIFDIGHNPVKTAPSARPVGALRPKRAFLQSKF